MSVAAGLGADAALVTNSVNVRYLTGLVSSNAAILIPVQGGAVLCTDARYAGTAEEQCPDVDLVIERDVESALVERAFAEGLTTLAFEDREMTVRRYRELTEARRTETAPRQLALVPAGDAIDELRIVKDEDEISLLAQACAITSDAFTATLDRLRPGVRERDFAIALERAMVDLGADKPAFDTIVASGPNGAIPHHVPGNRQFQAGDLVTIDCGAEFGGYHADMTRTIALGRPAAWQRQIYRFVADAQAAGVAAARPGAEVADVDAAARDLIEAAGYGANFRHGLGHGVGLEVHEAPIISHGRAGKLHDRVPITIEPGIYLPGSGGVRIEDTLVVRTGTEAAGVPGAAGLAQSLTTITRELLVL